MTPRTRLFRHRVLRSRALLATTLFAATTLVAAACIPPTPPPRTTTTTTTTAPPLEPCPVPDAPVLDVISAEETLVFDIDGGGPIEVAVVEPDSEPGEGDFVEASELPLAALDGAVRVVARSAAGDCEPLERFDARYEVRPTYPGRPDLPGSDSTAVAATSDRFSGWATGYVDYLPGADVTANFQTPANAVGPYTTALAVLGNGGSITMTFDRAITDGPGADLAVFENGFYENATSQRLFTELAYVEVSSNGVDFVRFDSASRRATPVGSFEFQDVRELGGLAGKDGSGWGTSFDLSTLANKAQVRSGAVDLSAITHVRIVDVVGASDYPNPGDEYLDSFGRQIFDTHLTVGSGGFDLRAVGALHQVDLP